MSKTPSGVRGTYFQFPLCALAFGRSDVERLNAIMSFGLVEAGRILWEKKFTQQDRQKQYEAWANPARVPPDFNQQNSLHVFAVVGASVINVRLGYLSRLLVEHKALCDFRDKFVARHGPQPTVRLKSQLVFEARDGKGITPGELGVLAGIYSVIGNKRRPVLITQRRIGWRAMGYKSEAVYMAELARRTDGAKPLTNWQLRSTIDRLHTRKFYCRTTYGCRLTYYNHRMNEREFSEALISMKTRKFTSNRLRQCRDEELTNAIRNQRAALMGKLPPAPDAKPFVLEGGFLPNDVAF